MDYLRLFTQCYSLLHNYRGLPVYSFSPFRKVIRIGANTFLPKYLKKSFKYSDIRNENVIVSFTSFPERINDVWLVVQSLKRQTVLPDKIILWLSNKQFPGKDSIPQSLLTEIDNLFEIRMVDGDIRSHKKFFYVMKEFPEKAFITCDDDIFYHPDTIKNLIKSSCKFPGCIVANKARQIPIGLGGDLPKYNSWKQDLPAYTSKDLMQIGVGGVLYPPGSLHSMTLQKDLFMSLTPMADDIWLNCMARLNKTPVVQSPMKLIPLPIKSDSPSLSSVNKGQNRNDVQISELRSYLVENGFVDVYDNYHIEYK